MLPKSTVNSKLRKTPRYQNRENKIIWIIVFNSHSIVAKRNDGSFVFLQQISHDRQVYWADWRSTSHLIIKTSLSRAPLWHCTYRNFKNHPEWLALTRSFKDTLHHRGLPSNELAAFRCQSLKRRNFLSCSLHFRWKI